MQFADSPCCCAPECDCPKHRNAAHNPSASGLASAQQLKDRLLAPASSISTAYPLPIPIVMIEENIAPFFGLWTDLDWIRQVMVLCHPHLKDLVISPVTSRSIIISIARARSCWTNSQFRCCLFLDYILRLGVENPKECLIREPRDLIHHLVDIVDGVAIR